jgi:hypothetical protein
MNTAALGPGKYAERTSDRPTGRPLPGWLKPNAITRPTKSSRPGPSTQVPRLNDTLSPSR